MSIQTLARFPFLSEAASAVKALGLSIDELLESLAYRSAWTRAKDRLFETLDFGEIKEHGITTEAECINELLSYVIARIIVSSVKDQFLVRRYALAEAVYAYKELQNKDTKFITDVASQFYLIPLDVNENQIDLNIVDYLKYSISLRDPELKWKLINRDVHDGRVTVSSRDLARLIQEAIRIKINDELPIDIEPELNKKIKPRIKDLIESVKSRKKKYETRDLGKVSITRFPPCMKQLLGMTQAGENVSHVGRFALAAFLHHIGLSSDDILVVYSTAPDFDTQKARYQIEHITGKISGTEYTPPGCDSMKSNGVCYNPDSLCNRDWMNHPLSYYRIKGKRKKVQEKTKQKLKENGQVKT